MDEKHKTKQIKSFIQIGRKQHNKQLLENDGLKSRAATAHRQQQRLSSRSPPTSNSRPSSTPPSARAPAPSSDDA